MSGLPGRWIECYRCAEPIWLSATQEQALRRNCNHFYCLWGHEQHYSLGPTREAELRLERDRLKQQLAQKDDEITDANRRAAHAKKQLAASRGEVTRLHKRTENGVCPCCNRTFANLARHMASKHKDRTPPPASPNLKVVA
jgi:hypothetical protein